MTEVAGVAELIGQKAPIQAAKNDDLGQEQFLELLVAQMKNQDPTDPVDNGEFLAQIAQFSTVSGIQDLQTSFSSMADSLYAGQTMQATALMGKQVLGDSNEGYMAEGVFIDGVLDVPSGASNIHSDECARCQWRTGR